MPLSDSQFNSISDLNALIKKTPYDVKVLETHGSGESDLLTELVNAWDTLWTGKDNKALRAKWSELVLTHKLRTGLFEYEPEEDVLRDLHKLNTPIEACYRLKIARPSLYHRTVKDPSANGYVRVRRLHPSTALKICQLSQGAYLELVGRSLNQELELLQDIHSKTYNPTADFASIRFFPGANYTVSKHKPMNLFELTDISFKKVKRGRGSGKLKNRKRGAVNKVHNANVRVKPDPNTPEFNLARIKLRMRGMDVQKIGGGYRVTLQNGISYRIFPSIQSIASEYNFSLNID